MANTEKLAPHQSRLNLPAGRTLADMPKGEPRPVPSGHAKPPNTNLTLRKWLTEDGTKEYLVELLKEMGKKKPKKWADHLNFYIANQSGDVHGMKPEVKARCEKLIKALNDEHFESQDL